MKSTNREEECKILYLDESNLTNEKMGMNLTGPSKALDCRFVRKRPPPRGVWCELRESSSREWRRGSAATQQIECDTPHTHSEGDSTNSPQQQAGVEPYK
jgi:hypothetical protein